MFKFKCHPDGGKAFEVVARSRAITAWENAPFQPKGQPRRKLGDITNGLDMGALVDLAWYAASRGGLTELDIREWRDQVDVDLEKYDEDADDDDSADEEGPTHVTR